MWWWLKVNVIWKTPWNSRELDTKQPVSKRWCLLFFQSTFVYGKSQSDFTWKYEEVVLELFLFWNSCYTTFTKTDTVDECHMCVFVCVLYLVHQVSREHYKQKWSGISKCDQLMQIKLYFKHTCIHYFLILLYFWSSRSSDSFIFLQPQFTWSWDVL